jgi:hypothetical protein
MKITKSQLKQLIKEELGNLSEGVLPDEEFAQIVEMLFAQDQPGNIFAEALATKLMFDEEEDFEELVGVLKSSLIDWYSKREYDKRDSKELKLGTPEFDPMKKLKPASMGGPNEDKLKE